MLKIAVRKTSPKVNQRSGQAEGDKATADPLLPRAKPDQINVVAWWTALACGRRSFVKIGNNVVGARCGSRSCFSCARNKLERFGNIATHLKREPGEVFRSCVLTPRDNRQTRTRKDIAEFFSNFRKMLRSWNRSAGLGYAFWTAEGVVKWDEQGSITCPLRQSVPPDEWLYNSSADLKVEVKNLRQQCYDGNCKFCQGSGYLPAVHLHVHLLTSSKPFYYGAGESDTALAAMHPDGKGGYTGLDGFCSRFGLFSRVETVRDVGHLQKYLSKAMVKYTTKGATDGKGKIDYEGSALEQAVVSWTIGNNRSRGAVGRAYGLSSRTKNINANIVMTDERAPERNALSCAVTGDDYTRQPRELDQSAFLVNTLTIGTGSELQNAINVLKKTQLDKGLKKTQLDSVVMVLDFPHKLKKGQWRLRPADKRLSSNDMLSRHWDAVTVVDHDELWTMKTAEGSIFARGGSMIFRPYRMSTIEQTRALLALDGLPYHYWGLYLDDLSRRETINRGGYDRAENREMA